MAGNNPYGDSYGVTKLNVLKYIETHICEVCCGALAHQAYMDS